MSNRYERSQLMLGQRRYELAERELRGLLADEPNDGIALALLALCILHAKERMIEASDTAQRAVAVAPSEPLCHYALATCYLQRNRFDEAEAAIQTSLTLDPHDADAFAVLARAMFGRKRYEDALATVEQGLAIDPEHGDCSSLRAITLERLGRDTEAVAAATNRLKLDPQDPMAHASYGYTLLQAGDYQQAQVAFREALRLDPANEMARAGLITALNNRSFLFRMVHRFYVSLSRLNGKAAFYLIVGAWVLMQLLSRLAEQYPVLQPVVFPIIVLYAMFVILTWIANPLFNTFLRFHPFGQHLLNRSQTWASNLIAPCLLISGCSLIIGVLCSDIWLGVLAGAYWLGMAVPIACTFGMEDQRRRVYLGAITVAIALIPVGGTVLSLLADSSVPVISSFSWFAYSLLAFQIGSNLLGTRPVKA
ncbi:tetratricopeptide repeat protein [Rhodopirellula sp.]|nr:tetratricopeptide repeat protein [Rubripirellula sp.]MDA7874110.1 tetratricopeptide repeat protein [Rhodopirellula sp.]MDB4561531.1 tetratricopeptide repeat protein [bacterium]MDB4621707.1 tetratricopeptide repeat protein [Rubripirellula sp.]